jgi:hypothetical protein
MAVDGTKPLPVRVTMVVCPAGTMAGLAAVMAGIGLIRLSEYEAVIAGLETSAA